MLLTLALSFVFLFQFSNQTSRSQILAISKQDRINPASATAEQLVSCTFYRWFDPNTTDKEGKLLLKNCSSCHMAYYKEWINDKHATSQNNPFFLSIYKQFKQDHPDQNGNCALCHNPEAVLPDKDTSLGRLNDVDLREMRSKKTNGISCDFCHKIESVNQNPLLKGAAGLKIARACKGFKDIRFGPLKDPIQPSNKEELKYNSLFKTSLSCAKCHDGSNGNIQIYSTFTEWLNSPAAKKGVQCQSCHMTPRKNANTIVDNSAKAIHELPQHKQRPYYEVHSHSFLTENPSAFRKKYIDLKTETRLIASQQRNTLIVKIIVENNNPGHSFPTGSPMRNAVLLIEAKDTNGKNLKLIKGLRLPNYAGNLRNKPGKLFAKILAETNSEYAVQHGQAGIIFRKLATELGIPAQDWWNIFVLSDTRIKANGNDISTYEFNVGAPFHGTQQTGTIKITAKLIWRNTWPGLAELKGIPINEDILIERDVNLPH